jgi:DNA-binding IclR family transcriptional regulator
MNSPSLEEPAQLDVSETSGIKPAVRVLERAASILAVLEKHDGPVTLGVLAKEAGLSKPTTHRLVNSLLRLHLVEPGSEPASYQLGMWLFRLGASVQRRLDVRTRALPHLRHLNQATEETTYLCIREARSVVCVERLEGQHVASLRLKLGGSLPLSVGAASRVLLAFLPDTELEQFLQGERESFTGHTLMSREELLHDVAETRTKGYVISDQDVTEGVCAIGAPVFDTHGHVVAAVSISGMAPRFSEPRRSELVALVKDSAMAISIDLGHHPDAPLPLHGRIRDEQHQS